MTYLTFAYGNVLVVTYFQLDATLREVADALTDAGILFSGGSR